VVNVYSYRQPELIQPLLDAFTKESGVETQVIFAEKGLEERIKAEGENSPADVILTVDISRLEAAKEAGVTQPVQDEAVGRQHPGSVSRSRRATGWA
jgi:iron(III) transport system substrate-binding protein